MKILIVTNMYPSKGDVSWRGGFVKDQVESVRLKLHPDDKIDVFHIKGPISGGGLKEYLYNWPLLLTRLIFGRYDVVHSHHSFCTLMCIPWFYRLFYTVHEGELNNTSWRSLLIKLAIFFSGHVIYVSKKEYENSTKKRKYFVPCGVDDSIFTPLDDKSLCDKNRILFPADPKRLEKNGEILKEVELRSKQEGRSWSFKYGGNIPKDEMPNLMASSGIVVTIGKFESDGMVVKESMACNTPVISTDVGNSKYYLDDCSGVICEETSESVYRAIDKILSNWEGYKKGRESLISKQQSSSMVAAKVKNLYERSYAN